MRAKSLTCWGLLGHIFDLNEEINRQLPHVRSLRLIREDRYGGWLKCIAL